MLSTVHVLQYVDVTYTSLHMPAAETHVFLYMQWEPTKERIIALIDADQAMLETLAQEVHTTQPS